MIYLHKRTKPLDLYLPEEFIAPFKNYLQAVYLLEEKMPFRINFFPLTDSYLFQNEQFQIQAILNDHLQGYEEIIQKNNLPNKMQSFSFLISVNEKKVLYSSDLATMNPIEKYLDGLDSLIIETTHIKIDELLVTLKGKNINQLIITHLGSKDETMKYVLKAQEEGLQNLIVAIDGMEIQL